MSARYATASVEVLHDCEPTYKCEVCQMLGRDNTYARYNVFDGRNGSRMVCGNHLSTMVDREATFK